MIFKNSLRVARANLVLALDPLRFKQRRLMRDATAPVEEKINFDAYPRPHFAYGVHRAAMQAKALGIDAISVIEFGCAGGNGLLALEAMALEIGKDVGVRVDVYGFDVGEGLPKPLDYRDLPYAWKMEQFKMDVPKLKARLTAAQLVIGDVADTVEPFGQREGLAPVGFISFDLDYYSSTMAAFKIFDAETAKMLPRVYCYFDDIIGPDNELHCEYVGELLAIKDFNASKSAKKIAQINGLSWKRYIPAPWNDSMFIMHAFDHPLYGVYIDTKVDMDLALDSTN
ncbi:hypothetical protein FIU86_13870 [Roseovarius sp. THAF9]|uniref:hypothetical protein n=1 Tax=Roseovarius sp. THAF9 TaxID=2587847 RepID=UPI0012682212|nr:hypothetical protein [Roseovarius sp. THAF9]QFT93933.1 hypothetical protein FIU86_13870 [Roseovarius sp. THAF9]